MNTPSTQQRKSQAPKMFDTIAYRYDLVNRLLSLGLDRSWRRRLLASLNLARTHRFLDCATGTGDVLLAAGSEEAAPAQCWGQDMSLNMLEALQGKLRWRQIHGQVTLCGSDTQRLPFKDACFDRAAIAFGIRNMPEPVVALSEMYRVLAASGKLCVLEFSLPKNPLLRLGHWLFLRTVVPTIGALVTGKWSAYSYLGSTILAFPYGRRFLALMREAGFESVEAHPLNGGIVTIYTGQKRQH